MESLTSAQQAVQAIKSDNDKAVAQIEINGVKYDVVYKEDNGTFRDLSGLDTTAIEKLASAVLSAHEVDAPKPLSERSISHIDSTGIHYTDKTEEAHDKKHLNEEGFQALDKHLEIASTINGISTVYAGVKELDEKTEIKYEAVLEALPKDLSEMVLKEITKGSKHITKETFLTTLDLCANEYLGQKIDLSSGASPEKKAIVHKSDEDSTVDKEASLQAFKEAATAQHAWDVMTKTMSKTHSVATTPESSKESSSKDSPLKAGATVTPATGEPSGKSKESKKAKDLPKSLAAGDGIKPSTKKEASESSDDSSAASPKVQDAEKDASLKSPDKKEGNPIVDSDTDEAFETPVGSSDEGEPDSASETDDKEDRTPSELPASDLEFLPGGFTLVAHQEGGEASANQVEDEKKRWGEIFTGRPKGPANRRPKTKNKASGKQTDPFSAEDLNRLEIKVKFSKLVEIKEEAVKAGTNLRNIRIEDEKKREFSQDILLYLAGKSKKLKSEGAATYLLYLVNLHNRVGGTDGEKMNAMVARLKDEAKLGSKKDS